jgi:hypothetical protein
MPIITRVNNTLNKNQNNFIAKQSYKNEPL